MDEFYEDTGRVEVLFLMAYGKLLEKGLISQAEYDDVVDALENMDELSEEELKQRLSVFQRITSA